MKVARYDAVADFYEAGWPDSYDDSVSIALLEQIGPVDGLRILDVACGHGRIARELTRRGGHVVGIDISTALVVRAAAAERRHPLGTRYVVGDIASAAFSPVDGAFDLVVCSFGLSDIDDLEAALDAIAAALRPGGRFVFSILHPCFAGAGDVSGAWPATGSYYDETWWVADGEQSTLRRQVGANHRMLSTYFNTLRAHDLWVDTAAEPAPPSDWTASERQASRYPVFLVVSCARQAPG